MDLEKFWKNTVKKGHRHIVNQISEEKQKVLKDRFQKHVLDQINTKNTKNAVDWGCGGGLLSKMIPKHTNLYIVDLLHHSLDSTEKYIKRPVTKIKLDKIEDFSVSFPDIDLLWCYSVIHHFPSFEYFKQACSKWCDINPKRIAIKTKFWKETKEAKRYSDGFLDALILSKKDLVDQFPNYRLEYWEEKETSKYWNLGFAIFNRQ